MKNIIFTYGLILTVLGGCCGWMTAFSYWKQRSQAMATLRESTDIIERAGIAIDEANEEIEMYLRKEDGNWEALIEALIFVESSGNPDAIGDGGDAVGVLQIHPRTVADCNRILGRDEFTPADRLSRERSIEMFNVLQGHYNPGRDMHFALKLHNPRAPVSYHRRVMKEMKTRREFAGQ